MDSISGNGIVRETEEGGSLAEHPMFPLVRQWADMDLDTLECTVGELRELTDKLRHLFQLRSILREIAGEKHG